ncbi:MAG: transposase [Acidobacteriaceae bacterium]|nr:transposase [Acidobacteriaceae bacterium]
MIIVGCDYHPEFQQITFVDTDTGELQERRIQHREEAEKFYRDLAAQGMKVRVGMEASGHARWFERLLGESATPAALRRSESRTRSRHLRPRRA